MPFTRLSGRGTIQFFIHDMSNQVRYMYAYLCNILKSIGNFCGKLVNKLSAKKSLANKNPPLKDLFVKNVGIYKIITC
jgi:hypothetical protein